MESKTNGLFNKCIRQIREISAVEERGATMRVKCSASVLMEDAMIYSGKKDISVGDQVITQNNRLGKVVRLDRDDFGDYVIVKFILLNWEFAYDPWELQKVSPERLPY